jgi:hypothetical protein
MEERKYNMFSKHIKHYLKIVSFDNINGRKGILYNRGLKKNIIFFYNVHFFFATNDSEKT